MPTAVADHEPLVAQPDQTVLFMSRRSELRLVMQPRYPIMGAHPGQRIGETRGITVAFRDGQIRIPKEGEAVIMDPGGAGQARVDSAELIDFLQNHPRAGDYNEGFWRVDPTAPPVSEDETRRIVEAATSWDKDTLLEIAAQEREGWGRQQVIDAAQQALARIMELETISEQKVAEEVERRVAEATKAAKPKGGAA